MADFDVEQATRAYIDSLGADALARAADYTTGNHWLLLGSLLVSALVTAIIVRLGWLEAIERRLGPVSNIGVFLIGVAYVLLSSLITLPWTLYSAWWRELQYGRSSQALADFLGQSLIGLAISAVILPPFLVLLYLLIRRARTTWWLWGGGLTALSISLLMLLAPVYLMPLFNDYQPLPEGEVRDAVEALAIEAEIPTNRIFVFDGSRQSNNFTANVAGIGSSARIAISDVALDEASLDEVKAVTGHEVGHYVLGHVWYGIGAYSLLAVLFFLIAARSFPRFARLFGADPDIARPASLPVLLFVVTLLGTFAEPVVNALSRLDENAADQYSLETVGLPDALASALVKTAEYRNPRPGQWEETLFYTHPSVERRVRRAMAWKAANE
jgi:STE24 endopeptidase